MRAALAAAKVVSMSSFQGKALGLPERVAVSGRSVPAIRGGKALEIHHT
jgi:hypothetical protein